MSNKRALQIATKELNKAKAPKQPKDIIYDPAGQWKYPGQNTRIPGDDITMQGVPYPVYGKPNIGEPQMMYPGQDYVFPGADYVDEFPQMRKGGIPKYLKLPKNYGRRQYSNNISATNRLFAKNFLFRKEKNKIYDPNAKYAEGGEQGCPEGYAFNPKTGECIEWNPDIRESYDQATSFDPVGDVIYMNPNDRPEGMSDEEYAQMYNDQLEHEQLHRLQWKNDELKGESKTPLRMPSTVDNEDFGGDHYYNRRGEEVNYLHDYWKNHHPDEAAFIPDDVIYNYETDPAMYQLPWTVEGEARGYEHATHDGMESLFPKRVYGGVPEYAPGGTTGCPDGQHWDIIKKRCVTVFKSAKKEKIKTDKDLPTLWFTGGDKEYDKFLKRKAAYEDSAKLYNFSNDRLKDAVSKGGKLSVSKKAKDLKFLKEYNEGRKIKADKFYDISYPPGTKDTSWTGTISYPKPKQPVAFKRVDKPVKKKEEPVKEKIVIDKLPIKQAVIDQPKKDIIDNSVPVPPKISIETESDYTPKYIEEGGPDSTGWHVEDRTKRYIDWDGTSIGYRLPRFRKPGHGGPLIKKGKKRYLHLPTIEKRTEAWLEPNEDIKEEYQDGGQHRTKLTPEEEFDFQAFFRTLPNNLQTDDDTYDIRGYWDSEGRPETFNYDQPKEDDGYYHAYSINQNTGEYLKSPAHDTFQHAVDEDRKIGYRPLTNVYGRNIATENQSIADPEEQSFLRNTEGPANYIEAELTPEEIEQYAKGGYIIEDISTPSLNQYQDGGENNFYSVKGSKGVYRKVNGKWEVDWDKTGNFQPLSKGDVKKRSEQLNKNAELLFDPNYSDLISSQKAEYKPIPKAEPKKKLTSGQAAAQKAFTKDFKVSGKDRLGKAEDKIEKGVEDYIKYHNENFDKPLTQQDIDNARETISNNVMASEDVYDPSAGEFNTNRKSISNADAKNFVAFNEKPKNLTAGDYLEKGWDIASNPLDYASYFLKPKGTVNTPWNMHEYEKRLEKVGAEDPVTNNLVSEGLDFASWFLPAGMVAQGIKMIPDTAESIGTAVEDPTLSNIGKAAFDTGMTAISVMPGFKYAKEGAKYLTESTPLRNAYKVNPWAFKPNPESYYRMIGKEGYADALESGIIRPPQTSRIFDQSSQKYINIPIPAYEEAYYNAQFPLDRRWYPNSIKKINSKKAATAKKSGYAGPYMAEVTGNPHLFENGENVAAYTGPNSSQTVTYSKEFIPINTPGVKFYKEDWLRGYKPIETPKQLPGSPNAIESPAGFQNRVFDTNVQLGEFKGKGHLSEKGYNYRTLGDEEINSIKEFRAVLPKKGKAKGGNENVKYWTKGNEKNWYAENPNQQVIRVNENKFSKDKVVNADDVEIYNHELGTFEPIISKKSNKSFMGKVKDYFDRPPGPLMLGMSKGAVFNKEIKNPDYFLDLMKINKYSPKQKKYFEDLVANVKKQGNMASEKQYEELQRLKTGDMNYGKKGYAKGGIVSKLSQKEINDLVAQGYIVEDID